MMPAQGWIDIQASRGEYARAAASGPATAAPNPATQPWRHCGTYRNRGAYPRLGSPAATV